MIDRKTLLAEAAARMRAAGVEGAERDARVLLRWASGLSAASLSAALDVAPDEVERSRFEAAVKARMERQPVSQITGEREFWGRSFHVTSDVLDPRPETETLIEAALSGPAPRRILDLGVGSGCILLTLLAEWPSATGLGIDVSAAALTVATENAERLGVSDRAEFQIGDWLAGVDGAIDLVVSNPPYIPTNEMPTLQPEVRDWEPGAALSPGGDGLDAYRKIAARLRAVLAPNGRAILEHGVGQGDDVRAIFAAEGLKFRRFYTDLSHRRRCIELGS